METWTDWSGDTTVAGGRQHQAFELGRLLPGVLKYLRDEHNVDVENATVVTTRGIQRHLLRPSKSAARLTDADLTRFPEIIAAPKAVLYDAKDPALLYVFVPANAAETRLGKIVVRVNFSLDAQFKGDNRARTTANAVRTAGYVSPTDLKEPRYKLALGKLE